MLQSAYRRIHSGVFARAIAAALVIGHAIVCKLALPSLQVVFSLSEVHRNIDRIDHRPPTCGMRIIFVVLQKRRVAQRVGGSSEHVFGSGWLGRDRRALGEGMADPGRDIDLLRDRWPAGWEPEL